MTDDIVRRHIEQWSEELVDLTRRNRLLYFKHTRSASLQFAQTASAIEGRLRQGRKWQFYLPPRPPTDPLEATLYDPTQPNKNELVIEMEPKRYEDTINRNLKSLWKKSIDVMLDSGLWVLYMGLGMLRWNDEGKEVTSPLLLIPVQLEQKRGHWELQASDEGQSAINPALAVKFERDFDIKLPSLDELPDQGMHTVIEGVRNAITSFSTARVDDVGVLTTFTFHKEVIYRDLKQNMDDIMAHPIVRLLAEGPTSDAAQTFSFPPMSDNDLDRKHPPEETTCILDADATQRKCLIVARKGNSFVMDGPPGTGKSQTIVNMIAQLISDGKSVLFVSEKAAALEVVYKRLAERNLSPFALALHSHNASRKEVVKELADALIKRPIAQISPSKLQNKEVLLLNKDKLSKYAASMNCERPPLGSLQQAIGRILLIQGYDDIPVPEINLENLKRDFANMKIQANQLGQAWGPISLGNEFLWRDLQVSNEGMSDQIQIQRIVSECRDRYSQLYDLILRINKENDLQINKLSELPWLHRLFKILEYCPSGNLYLMLSGDPERTLDEMEQLLNFLTVRDEIASGLDNTSHRWKQVSLGSVSARKEQVDSVSEQLSRTIEALEHSYRMGAVLDERDTNLPGLLQKNRQQVRQLVDIGKSLVQKTNDLSSIWEMETADLSLDLIDRLARLCALSASVHQPNPDWFNLAIERLENAVHTLRSSLDEFLAYRRQLNNVFTEEALDLDLKMLRNRFFERYTGLRKLGKAYREDKKMLAKVTVIGRYSKNILTHLNDAIKWQEGYMKLKKDEKLYSELIGEHYWQDIDNIDMSVIEQAVSVCKEAQELALTYVNPSLLAKNIGYGFRHHPQMRIVGESVSDLLAKFLNEANGGVKFDIKVNHSSCSFSDLIDLLAQLSEILNDQIPFIQTEINDLFGFRNEQELLLSDLRTILEQYLKYHKISKEAESTALSLSSYFDRTLEVLDYKLMKRVVDWAKSLLDHLNRSTNSISETTAEHLFRNNLPTRELGEAFDKFEKALRELVDLFKPDYGKGKIENELRSFSLNGQRFLDNLYETVGDINEWNAFDESYKALAQANLKSVVDECIKMRVPHTKVGKLIERSILQSWVGQVMHREREQLQPYLGKLREGIRREYQDLDRKHIRETVAEVINNCSERRPKQLLGGAGVILQQSKLKRGHKPVRQLLKEAGQVALKIKPCFMMSPLSISQFLPLELRFDVVIFDEASQIRTSDAICAISRGDQLIVAGDDKQLPPTNFFQSTTYYDDQNDEEELLDFESLLDLCKGQGLSSLPLLWHYRSRHESLITFSNRQFYEGRLYTFPGAVAEATNLGVKLIQVDGIYERGGRRDNVIEAKKVVERIVYHRRKHPNMTIGVVTLSQSQQSTIERFVEREASKMPDLLDIYSEDRLDGLFIKNLETVQGDERDIIIISIGYGPDEYGRMTMNFGPMNRQGGERRLNVAVTRARFRVEVICSFKPSKLRSSTTNPTISCLARYLEYADKGINALAMDLTDSEGDVESPFEEAVLWSIKQLGYEGVPQVGCAGYRIDIGVKHPTKPGEYLMGVECDGASYHSSKDARSRDRLRQEVLEGLGWKIYRIWSTAWYRDRKGEEKRLKETIDNALDETSHIQSPSSLPPPDVQVKKKNFSDQPEWVHDYFEPGLEPAPNHLEFKSQYSEKVIANQILCIVTQAGPIHTDRIRKIVLQAWLKRDHQTYHNVYYNIIHNLVRSRHIVWDKAHGVWDKHFLVLPDSEPGVRVFESNDVTIPDVRLVEHIPPSEIQLAIFNFIKEAGGGPVQRNELISTLVKLYGWKRRTQKRSKVFNKALDGLAEENILEETDKGFTLDDESKRS